MSEDASSDICPVTLDIYTYLNRLPVKLKRYSSGGLLSLPSSFSTNQMYRVMVPEIFTPLRVAASRTAPAGPGCDPTPSML